MSEHVLDRMEARLDRQGGIVEGCSCIDCEAWREDFRILRAERERVVDIGDELASMLDMAASISDIDSEGSVTELLAAWKSARGDHWRGGEG